MNALCVISHSLRYALRPSTFSHLTSKRCFHRIQTTSARQLRKALTSTNVLTRPQTYQRRFHKNYDPAWEDQTITLRDGRTLGYSEHGIRTSTHSSTTPSPTVIFLHGAPGSRYDGTEYGTLARRMSIRLITPDRPGHGLSTHYAERKLLDYPDDIRQLAAHLGVTRYSVFGQSGGGPYAAACAYAIPETELVSVAIVAGMGPPELITLKDAGWYTVLAMWANKNLGGLMQRVNEWMYPSSYMASDEKLQRTLDRMYKLLSERDRKLASIAEAQPIIRASLRAAAAQGWAGIIREAQIYSEPWGFELADVRRRVLLFFGGRDNRTPVGFGRYYRDRLGDEYAELWEYEKASHWSIGLYGEEILGKILGRKVEDGKIVGIERDEKEDREIEELLKEFC